ncbi:hypothetical protein TNCV_1308621 [Trichonephila clavipes]|nr:hypothetical protein TNCV_1308621 [Trichonephila clavipes]
MMYKATANNRRHLALRNNEFRGPRSGLCRSGLLATGIAILNLGRVTETKPEIACPLQNITPGQVALGSEFGTF